MISWKDVCYLCNEVETLDKLGRPKKSYTEKKIFCNKKSIRQNEFYQAKVDGYKPEVMIIIKSCEYNNENHLKIENKLYRISRTYEKGDDMELICTSMVVENE